MENNESARSMSICYIPEESSKNKQTKENKKKTCGTVLQLVPPFIGCVFSSPLTPIHLHGLLNRDKTFDCVRIVWGQIGELNEDINKVIILQHLCLQ